MSAIDVPASLIPVTVLTGFLGAGKTTLLNRILSEPHGHRIAVIENEFGEIGVDNVLLKRNTDEQVLVMNNGCICCTVRDDLVRILGELAEKRAAGELDFERVLIETTGLADPGPVAQTFFVDPGVAAHYELDAVIAVVDALHGMQQLDAHHEARAQAGFADRLLLSKTDLVTPGQVAQLSERLLAMNGRAPILPVHFGKTDLAQILDIDAFSLQVAETATPGFRRYFRHHHHDDDVAAFSIRLSEPLSPVRFRLALGALIDKYSAQMLRYKGVVHLAGYDDQVILQGVHMLMALNLAEPWVPDSPRESVLVFIGERLPEAEFREVINASIHRPDAEADARFEAAMKIIDDVPF